MNLEDETLDLTVDEIAYEEYKLGYISYSDYVNVCRDEETEALPPIEK